MMLELQDDGVLLYTYKIYKFGLIINIESN